MDDGRKKEAAKAVCLLGDLKKKKKKEEAEIKVTTVDTVITVGDNTDALPKDIPAENNTVTTNEEYGTNVVAFRGREK